MFMICGNRPRCLLRLTGGGAARRLRSCLVACLLAAAYDLSAQTPPGEAQSLTPGRVIERTLKFGEVHPYHVALERGEYLHVGLRMGGKDIQVQVGAFAPDGRKLADLHNNVDLDERGVSAFVLIAEAPGLHRLELRSADKPEVSGEYTIFLKERRAAGERERKLVAAMHKFSAAHWLHTRVTTGEALGEAGRLYREVIALFEQAGYPARQAEALMLLSDVHNSFGEYREALPVARQALAVARAVGDPLRMADTLMTLGETHHHLNEYRRAIEAYQQALPLWQSLGRKHTTGVGWALYDLGSAYRALGEKETAAGYFARALKIYQEIDYSTREKYRGSANAASSLGAMYSALGEKQRAIDALTLALDSARQINDPWVEGWPHQYLGELYSSLGEPEAALKHYTQALALWRKAGDPAAIAAALTTMGGLHLAAKNLPAALDHLSQALEIGVRHNIQGRQARVLTLLGNAHREAGDLRRALDEYRRALPLWRGISDRGGEAIALLEMGETLYRLGDYAPALDHLQQALPLRRAVADREGEAATLYHLARVERALGRFDAAREHASGALSLIEAVRASVRSLDLRASYTATVQDYFALYIDLLMRADEREPQGGHAAEALTVSERARARSLLDALGEARFDIRAGVDAELLARERRARQLLNDKAAYQTRLLGGSPSPEQKAAAAAEVQAALAEFQAVAAAIRSRSPRYAALAFPQPLTLAAIREQVLDDDTLLLEYALGEERSYLWAVTRDSLETFTLPPRAEVEAAARRAYELMAATRHSAEAEPDARRRKLAAGANAGWQAAAAELRRMVLPDALRLGRRRLLVVAQGALQFVPFGALPLRGSRAPLVVKHEVVYSPSASTLAVMRQELKGRARAPKAVAIFADPVFSADDPRLKVAAGAPQSGLREAAGQARAGLSADLERAVSDVSDGASDGDAGYEFRRLLATRYEAERIASFAGAKGVLKALDFAANRALALSPELSQYRIVHFASHAFINDRHPELSGLVLSLVDERGQPQDGFLRAHELFNLKLPAELVVLSACRTGLGREIRGEGLMSLTRGLMYAGAARVGVSLWAVEDRAAAQLMTLFYRRLLGPGRLTPAEALAAAQAEMWRSRRWSAPYYWAAFGVQGEWE
jgi:CHAT domain-containing protein/tetratricopeptide (TPR) repeat protein